MLIGGDMKIRVNKPQWAKGIEVLITQGNKIATSITMDERDEGMMCTPTFMIGDLEAQELIDALWSVGFRPSEGSGSAGSLKATEKHLADMRLIALSGLKIEGKGE